MAEKPKQKTVDELRKELSYGEVGPAANVQDFGVNRDAFHYNDPSTKLALEKGYYIQIYHLISKTSIYFKAFLTDFADNFITSYNKEQVLGRTDPIQTFQSTERKINLAFDLVSSNIREAKANLDKSNRFASMMYPEYGAGGSATQLKSGPLFKIKMGNLICRPGLDISPGATSDASEDGLACTIAGFKYNPSIDDGFFDPKPGVFYPQTINIDLELTIIHEQANDDFIGWKDGEFQSAKVGDQGGEKSFPHAGEQPDANESPLATAREDMPSEYFESEQFIAALEAEGNRQAAQDRTDNAGNKESNVIMTERLKPAEQGIRSALVLQQSLAFERARIQANKLLSPKASQNLGAILNGDFLDIDIF